MRRLEALDGLRGYFLVFMVLNHLTFAGGYLLVRINHGELGYVQDAQGFVFLSGLLVGMVYSGHMKKRGYAAGAHRIHRRALELYGWALFCIFAILALGRLLPGSETFWRDHLWQLADADPGYAAASALLLYQPTYMDILPQYICYLLVAPPLVRLCLDGRAATVMAGSLALWLLVQFGFHQPIADAMDAALKALDPELTLRAFFNVFAWQLVFMSGLVLGTLAVSGTVRWNTVFDRERTAPVWAALGALVLFAFFKLGGHAGIVPSALAERFAHFDNRAEFSLVYLLNFAAAGYLVAWLMIAGVHRPEALPLRVGKALHFLSTRPFLTLIGRHSLHVYVWHVLLVYSVKALDHYAGPFDEPAKTAIALGAVASLGIPALWREHRAAEVRPTPVSAVATR